MVDLFVCWVLFVALYIVVALGFGLLAETASGARLPGVLLLPLGVAGVFVASQVVSYFSWSAPATTPAVVVIGAAGLVLGRRRLRQDRDRGPLDRWALAAALVVFGVFAAPIVLTGEPTFAGYTILGDTSIHFIGADYILHHGRHIGGLAPSSYEYSLESYYGTGGYPSGGPTAAGVLAPIVGEDIAWIFQPFLALLAAMTSLCIYALVARRIAAGWLRCFVAALAPQSALVLAYALQGSIKEVGTAWAIALLAALVAVFADQCPDGLRRVVPLAVAAGAGLSLISFSLAPWLGLFLLAAVVLAARRAGWRPAGLQAAAFALVAAVLSFPTLAVLGTFLPAVTGTVTSQKEYGNLLGSLDPLQMFGTWLSGDYRLKPDTTALFTATHILIGVSLVAAALGLVWAIRRRSWALLYIVVSVIGWYYVTRNGSPWAQAKALMIVSPAVMVAIALGPVALHESGRRLEAIGLAAVVAFGVLFSNALAYHDVSDAPWSRMVELERVGHRIAGQGPTLYTEFEEFGKHFLADADPESPGEGWQRRLALADQTTDGTAIHQGQSYDLDTFIPAYVDYYRTIVLRHGPAWSRPPSIYRRVWSGTYYEIWQRPPGSQNQIIAHLPLGTRTDPAAVPSCAAVGRLARDARGVGGRLAYATAPDPLVIVPSRTSYPPGWAVDPADPLSLVVKGPGKIQDSVVAPTPGVYDLWIDGSIGRPLRVYADGRYVGSESYQLEGRGQAIRVGAVTWTAGRHVITAVEAGGSPYPGNGENNRRLGPISAVPRIAGSGAVNYVAPAAWRALCGRPADWIEAVR